MYKTVICLCYYGLFRIGELTYTDSNHALKACDVHISNGNDKLLIFLKSSKTHGNYDKPQEIKITSAQAEELANCRRVKRHFCPVQLTSLYFTAQGDYDYNTEQFFIQRDFSPLKSNQVRTVLRKCISNLSLDSSLYNTHSLRSGRAVDLLKFGQNLDKIKSAGRWRSNVVYRYIKNF